MRRRILLIVFSCILLILSLVIFLAGNINPVLAEQVIVVKNKRQRIASFRGLKSDKVGLR